jgi:hypothetical protein
MLLTIYYYFLVSGLLNKNSKTDHVYESDKDVRIFYYNRRFIHFIANDSYEI